MDVGMGQTAATGLATARRIVVTISRDNNILKMRGWRGAKENSRQDPDLMWEGHEGGTKGI